MKKHWACFCECGGWMTGTGAEPMGKGRGAENGVGNLLLLDQKRDNSLFHILSLDLIIISLYKCTFWI